MSLTPSRLRLAHDRLILDASVLINLLGTGDLERILTCLRRRFVVDEITLREVSIDPFTGRSAKALLEGLRNRKLLQTVKMTDNTFDLFLSLSGAVPPDDLDDGEAATLAQAASGNCVPVLDEKKATRVCLTRFPELALLNSMDIIAAPEMCNQVGMDGVAEMIFLALQNSKMRVASRERQWVLELLGEERIAQCTSFGRLPRPTQGN